MKMSNFSLDFKKFADKAVKDTDDVIRRTALDLTTAIIMDSPVDKGRLRGAWLVSIDAEDNTDPNTPDKIGRETQKRAERDLEKPIGKAIYIQNNLDYAIPLEYGTAPFGFSAKAPQGMVRVNLLKFSNILESNANETRN
jgi:hypothetical protein